ncbi:hypothetical protein QQP08_017062 [Theobroma cacao]|nr:hypothetical protein QQP08_017062 [Theobroma cacao]
MTKSGLETLNLLEWYRKADTITKSKDYGKKLQKESARFLRPAATVRRIAAKIVPSEKLLEPYQAAACKGPYLTES